LFVKRTFATLRKAEFGFLGVVVYTLVHTPRRCGQASRALDLLFALMISLPFLTNCCIVGIYDLLKFFGRQKYEVVLKKTNPAPILLYLR
jgi:hypothetical protein